MIEETAQVVLVDENGTWVETRRKSSCGQCSVNAACGTSLLSSLLGNRASRIRVINKLGARTGDEVLLGMDESSMLKAAFVTYMQPLLLMLIAAMLGQAISVVIFTDRKSVV